MVGSRLTAVGVENTLKGSDKICGIIRPEGMSRSVGTAIQTKPGTGMIRPKGMSCPNGTTMSRPEMAIPGTGMICGPVGTSRPVGTAMQKKPGTKPICDMIRPKTRAAPRTRPCRQNRAQTWPVT
jgi:hypothetical protein